MLFSVVILTNIIFNIATFSNRLQQLYNALLFFIPTVPDKWPRKAA